MFKLLKCNWTNHFCSWIVGWSAGPQPIFGWFNCKFEMAAEASWFKRRQLLVETTVPTRFLVDSIAVECGLPTCFGWINCGWNNVGSQPVFGWFNCGWNNAGSQPVFGWINCGWDNHWFSCLIYTVLDPADVTFENVYPKWRQWNPFVHVALSWHIMHKVLYTTK